VQVNTAYKFELKVRSRQQRKLKRAGGCCRHVWNEMLALQKARLDWCEPILVSNDAEMVLAHWKRQNKEFLYHAPSQSLQQVVQFQVQAIFNAFNPEMPQEFPVFKKKNNRRDSFRIPQGMQWEREKHQVYIPNIGWFHYHKSYKKHELIGELRNMTVSQNGDHWFVSIGVQYEAEVKPHVNMTPTGIDLGIKNFAVLSDGTVIAPLNPYRKMERELAIEQRKASKMVKFSKNWEKQQAVVNDVHRRIANCRLNFLHQESNHITNTHGDLRMEALQVKNMSASAAGTIEEPGVNVAAKSGTNKSILDQGWGTMRRFVKYKVIRKGGKCSLVDPRNTSRECPECHHTEAGNRKTRDWFCCLKCGYAAPADFVASRNISQREALPEPAKRPPRKRRRSTKAQEVHVEAGTHPSSSANPTASAGILGL
jgi:putative transposase